MAGRTPNSQMAPPQPLPQRQGAPRARVKWRLCCQRGRSDCDGQSAAAAADPRPANPDCVDINKCERANRSPGRSACRFLAQDTDIPGDKCIHCPCMPTGCLPSLPPSEWPPFFLPQKREIGFRRRKLHFVPSSSRAAHARARHTAKPNKHVHAPRQR